MIIKLIKIIITIDGTIIQFHRKVRYHPKVRGNSQGMQYLNPPSCDHFSRHGA